MQIHANKDKSPTVISSRNTEKVERSNQNARFIMKIENVIAKSHEDENIREEQPQVRSRGISGFTSIGNAQKQVKRVISLEDMRRQKYHGSPKREDTMREAHKTIAEIQSVYNDQYQARLKRIKFTDIGLLPKLDLLSSARKKESYGSIPVLKAGSSYVQRRIS